jgi:hypothetical protein
VTPTYISQASSWEEADARFGTYLAEMPLRREQLAQRVAETAGPPLDRGVDGLDDLNEWYLDVGLAGLDDGMTWIPYHAPPATPPPGWEPSVMIPRWVAPQVSRLWAMVAVHVGDVLLRELEQSRWVVWRSRHANEVNNGVYGIDVGDPHHPADVIGLANGGLVYAYEHLGTGDHADRRPPGDRFRTGVLRELDRARAVRDSGTARWQKAPTGPDARRNVREFPGR